MYHDQLVDMIKRADQHNKNLLRKLNGDFNAARMFLFTKLVEEIGEYSEAIVLDRGDNIRKLRKFGCLDRNNVLNTKKFQTIAKDKLEEEIIDIFYVTLRLARLGKVPIENLIKYFHKKKGI